MIVTTSPPGLDSARRTQLERLVSRARATLEADISAQAEGRFGIHMDGTIEEEQALPDDASDRATRRDLVEIIDHVRSVGESQPEAVARMLREAAFTHLNRLLAIRIAEAIGLLPESLANGRQSRGFKDLGEIMPILGDDYWGYLLLCGDELAADAPALFDPRNPLLALAPSTPALDETVALLSSADATQLWLAPDTLGWSYQFFNTSDERRLMREGAAAPRTSRELAVRNQFFTPHYVVDFLVQNTLGRRLIENDPMSALLGELPLLLDPPTTAGAPLDLNDTSVLDPACGSGHFLLGCYDLLERAWELHGVPPSESAPAIVAALWGVDIDSRCAQVASAALVLRARRHCRDLPLPRPNIVTARSLPGESPAGLDLGPEQRRLVAGISEILADAPLLGTLLKAEEVLEHEIRQAAFGGETGTLPLTEAASTQVEADLMAHLQSVADQASSSVAERLLAAEADDALRLVEVTRNRYDAVLINPPFGLAVPSTERYLKTHYAEVWTDLYACFLVRGLELLRPTGYLGALTSSRYFLTRQMRGLRAKLLDESRPVAIVDLGSGVLQGATVDTACLVSPARRTSGVTALLNLRDKHADTRESEMHRRTSRTLESIDLRVFEPIEGHPFAVHVPAATISHWAAGARLEPEVAIVRTGAKTFDDFRFLRCRWEVDADFSVRGWRTYQKGGEYQPYLGPSHLLLDWRNDGAVIKATAVERGGLPQVMQSSRHWGRAGVCYPRMSSIGFSARVLPPDEVFSTVSVAVFPADGVDSVLLLGLVNSTTAAELLDVFGKGRVTETRAMKNLPVAPDDVMALEPVREAVLGIIGQFELVETWTETSALFIAPPQSAHPLSATPWEQVARRLPELQARVDECARRVFGAAERIDPTVEDRTQLILRALPSDWENPRKRADDWFSYLVGVAFGRWDLRFALDPSHATSVSVFDPLPPHAPGALVDSDGHPIHVQPEGYPLQVPPSGILVDEPGHAWDIEGAVLQAAGALFDEGIVADILGTLGRPAVRDHLRSKFFKDHLSRYSKSRRKAPIYWPLTVPSRRWGVWIYAPMLSRETLYAVAREAARRERLAVEAITRLQPEQQAGSLGRPARKIAEELDSEERLAEELRRFRTEAERIAGLGWEPNLDDGIVLCAAPLADLFLAWSDAKKARDELRKGGHKWAGVAQWAGEL